MKDMQNEIMRIVQEIFDVDIEVLLSVPEEQFGDLSTNVAMQLAKKVGNPLYSGPREVADMIAEKLRELDGVGEVSIAGPGFINIRLTDAALLAALDHVPAQTLEGQTVVCEYSDMNAFKTAHVGHLYTTLVGDAIANLLSVAGAIVIRANFGGDVGLHVARAMWAIMKFVDGDPSKLESISEADRSAWVADRYVEGTTADETDESAKIETGL
jgi:arginyl-tRNA synthetase